MKKLILPGVFSLSILSAFTPAFAQAGHLDPSFGNNGTVQTSFGSGNTFSVSGATLAPNGDIVVSGTVTTVSTSLDSSVIVRYLPTGALDTTFGNGGILTLPSPDAEALAFGVAVQADEKILAISDAFNTTGASQEILVRLNQNGQLDSTFGTGGQVAINIPAPSTYFSPQVETVLVEPGGQILLGGFTESFLRRNAPPVLTVLARYLSNGALDTSFGTSGFVEKAAVGNPSAVTLSGSNILVGNFLGQNAIFGPNGALLQVSPNPELAVNVRQATAFLPNGDFLVGTSVESPQLFKDNSDAVVDRYTISGLDTSFQSPLIRLGPDAPFVGNAPTGIGFDSAGRIDVGVTLGHSNGTTGNDIFSVVRLNSNGSLDTTFGNAGIGTIVASTFAGQILVQPNEDIVVVGNGTLVRYLAH